MFSTGRDTGGPRRRVRDRVPEPAWDRSSRIRTTGGPAWGPARRGYRKARWGRAALPRGDRHIRLSFLMPRTPPRRVCLLHQPSYPSASAPDPGRTQPGAVLASAWALGVSSSEGTLGKSPPARPTVRSLEAFARNVLPAALPSPRCRSGLHGITATFMPSPLAARSIASTVSSSGKRCVNIPSTFTRPDSMSPRATP